MKVKTNLAQSTVSREINRKVIYKRKGHQVAAKGRKMKPDHPARNTNWSHLARLGTYRKNHAAHETSRHFLIKTASSELIHVPRGTRE